MMLAKPFPVKYGTRTDPCIIQPKYNGWRVGYDIDTEECYSRTKHRLPNIIKNKFTKYKGLGYMLDGEYCFPFTNMRNPVGAIRNVLSRNPDSGLTKHLYFVVFDLISEDTTHEPYPVRLNKLIEVLDGEDDIQSSKIVLVTSKLSRFCDVHRDAMEFKDQGHTEGFIVRRLDRGYEEGRTDALYKYKYLTYRPYPIVSIDPGVNAFSNLAIFTCVVPESEDLFRVVLNGEHTMLNNILINKDEYVGKYVVVAASDFGDSGIPQHPRGVGIINTIEEFDARMYSESE